MDEREDSTSRTFSLENADAVPEPARTANTSAKIPVLDWVDCGDGFECSTARVPLDHTRPNGRQIELAVTRLPAADRVGRIGSLFVNFGGPGGGAVDALHDFGRELFGTLNERFDIVGFDPRGTGASEGSFNCGVDQRELGLYAQPFTTPFGPSVNAQLKRARAYIDACLDQDLDLLPYASTADGAKDMDLLRAALGDRQLSYLGFSYGTFLGATYASLFPTRYRALVLDGAVDADAYINRPSQGWRQQSAAFELALGRFFQACANDQTACSGFGGSDPWGSFDQLVAQANVQPLATNDPQGRVLNGEDLLMAALVCLYSKGSWPYLAASLAAAAQGDGSFALLLADASYGREEDGSYAPESDRFFLLAGTEPHYSTDVDDYLLSGEDSYGSYPHFWSNSGYAELPFGLLPVRARNAFYGPFRASSRAPRVLVVGTTYDPATPYRAAVSLTARLGNATLLSMQGDGHTAYGGNSSCIDTAVEAYFRDGVLPAPGTSCEQEVPFAALASAAPETETAGSSGSVAFRANALRFGRFGGPQPR